MASQQFDQPGGQEAGFALVAHVAPPEWERDADISICNLCRDPFSFSLRKHHCRACGRIFCKRCTDKVGMYSLAPAAHCTAGALNPVAGGVHWAGTGVRRLLQKVGQRETGGRSSENDGIH